MSSWDRRPSQKVALKERVAIENRIKLYRTVKGWNQHQLADQMGINVSTVHKVENRLLEPKISLVYKFCQVLDVPVELLFFKPGEVPPIKSDVK